MPEEIQQPEIVHAESKQDIVCLQLGSNHMKLYYQATFEIVNALRLASKLAMRHEGVQTPEWREVLDSVKGQLPTPVPLNRGYRRSNRAATVSKWEVTWSGAIVTLHLDDLHCGLHYTDCLRLMALLRVVATNCKRWSGDQTKAMRGLAYLNDAEENYKHGYAV